MQLTGKQIIERGIVTGVVTEGVQQQGVDVRLDKVIAFNPFGSVGYVPKEGKTELRARNNVAPRPSKNGGECWVLEPGYYEVIVKEGCKMPSNAAMRFISRSSLVRNGAIIHCGQFDAGFETEQMGFFLQVLFPITIERGARIAQAMVFETASVDEGSLYNGQWQGDQQRDQDSASKPVNTPESEMDKEIEGVIKQLKNAPGEVYDQVVKYIENGRILNAVEAINNATRCGLKFSHEVAKIIQEGYLRQEGAL